MPILLTGLTIAITLGIAGLLSWASGKALDRTVSVGGNVGMYNVQDTFGNTATVVNKGLKVALGDKSVTVENSIAQ